MEKIIPEPDRIDPLFVGDHRALDFLNTLATPVDLPVEWLDTGENLVRWLAEAGHITRPDAEACLRQNSEQKLNNIAAEARGFREWFRRLVLKHAGRSLGDVSEPVLRPLNELLSDSTVHWRAAPGSPPVLQTVHRWSDARQLLQPLAESAADLLCNIDFSLVRRCQGKGCTLIFLDKTKSHRRRWCSMAICGNRAKAAAFRAKNGGDEYAEV
jgi:predicted RNA-binding Zn ribbon-like protein